MIESHGTNSALVAAQRVDEMLSNGDSEGQLEWKHTLAAFNELQRTAPVANERRH